MGAVAMWAEKEEATTVLEVMAGAVMAVVAMEVAATVVVTKGRGGPTTLLNCGAKANAGGGAAPWLREANADTGGGSAPFGNGAMEDIGGAYCWYCWYCWYCCGYCWYWYC